MGRKYPVEPQYESRRPPGVNWMGRHGRRKGMVSLSSDVRLVGDVFDVIDGRLIAQRLDPFRERDRVDVGIVNAAAVRNPGDVLAVVLPQCLHGELATILEEHLP